MGYYIRVLGITDPNIHLEDLVIGLAEQGLTAKLSIDENEAADNWTILNVASPAGEELIQIERNPVVEGELGKEELEEFRESIQDYKPASAVRWLDRYFNNIKVIYAFQLLDAAFEDANFPIVGSIKHAIWKKTGGILQADNEGFSNEDGSHILWQFADNASGAWSMAVKNFFGNWTYFTMDLGDQRQREAFWEGKVPKGAEKG